MTTDQSSGTTSNVSQTVQKSCIIQVSKKLLPDDHHFPSFVPPYLSKGQTWLQTKMCTDSDTISPNSQEIVKLCEIVSISVWAYWCVWKDVLLQREGQPTKTIYWDLKMAHQQCNSGGKFGWDRNQQVQPDINDTLIIYSNHHDTKLL